MGAYLHLRGLAELGELSEFDPNMERFQSFSDASPGATDTPSTSTPRTAAAISGERKLPVTMEVDDCSNFWAGKLDEVFDEVEARRGNEDSPSARMVLDPSLQGDVDISGEQKLGRNEMGDSGPNLGGSTETTCTVGQLTENECLRKDSLEGLGGENGGLHGDVVPESQPLGFYTGGMDKNAASALSSGRDTSGSGSGTNGGSGSPLESCAGVLEGKELDSTDKRGGSCQESEDESERLPDHLLIELLVRVPTKDWPAAACVKKRWAELFKGDGLWQSALMKKWPTAANTKRWPGPIARGSSKRQSFSKRPLSFGRDKPLHLDWPLESFSIPARLISGTSGRETRRYTALQVSDALFAKDKVEGVDEVAGHVYLYLKEQLEATTPPVSYGLLHGTIIDQFLACCKTGDEAHDLASLIWVAVLDNLDESEQTFHLLMRIAGEWEVFLPYPYAKSRVVQWRLFERLFTDFRDCLSQYNYFDVLSRARNKFELIPQTWLGY